MPCAILKVKCVHKCEADNLVQVTSTDGTWLAEHAGKHV